MLSGGRDVGPPKMQGWRTITCSVLVSLLCHLILAMAKARFGAKSFKFFLFPNP